MKDGGIYVILRAEGYNRGFGYRAFSNQVLFSLGVTGYAHFISLKQENVLFNIKITYGLIIFLLTYFLLMGEIKSQVALQEYRNTLKEI